MKASFYLTEAWIKVAKVQSQTFDTCNDINYFSFKNDIMKCLSTHPNTRYQLKSNFKIKYLCNTFQSFVKNITQENCAFYPKRSTFHKGVSQSIQDFFFN